MVKESDYRINDLYQGGYSTLDSNYSPADISIGYQLPASQLGAPTKPDTANQIAQVSALLNQGIIPIEVGVLQQDVFDQIPKQHFKEINRMAKLAGSDISVHAPMIEASGLGDQGWSESARKLSEQQIIDVVDRTAPMNEKGGMSITFHSAVKLPGTEYKIDEKGNKVVEKMFIVNQETGKFHTAVEEEKKFYASTKDWNKGTVISPEYQIEMINRNEWDNSISQLMHHKEDADSRVKESIPLISTEVMHGLMTTKELKLEDLDPIERQGYARFKAAEQFMSDAQTSLTGLFNKAYKFGTEKDKETLRKAAKEYQDEIGKQKSDYFELLNSQSTAMQSMLGELSKIQPEIYKPAEDFAMDKSAETFARAALHAAKKYPDKAPKINIENFHPGSGFSYGKELDNLITTSRKKFVELAIEDGMSKSKAEQKAEEIIGVTLDVGHINMVKRKGFKDKDVLKEIEEIAKHVKHVHLTDNFGYGDSHLSPGMGNVPIKDILERLEKEGYEGKKIVEAGGLVQHFGQSPFPYMLEAFGSPIYGGGGPQWNQTTGLYQGYSGGFGQMLPTINYETFGAGWARLPAELGGSAPGASGSRMSGKPMA